MMRARVARPASGSYLVGIGGAVMAESETRSSSRPKTKDVSRAKVRIESSHTNKKITAVKHAAPKRFSHSAIGNR